MLESLLVERIDIEWAELILDALEIGLSPDDIRAFFNQYRPE
ncbi:anti-repressor SinI family protein [Metabacillus malikii]|uniref:DNA-binding transcriptional MerR regulator n=1 Tax=Metabacillus malikii TaxID=1504265 RepID=A0ABT9ZEQ3_9BACI|nr:anti-repressor SinI family protein [Metabacillus malikii]MDQ0230316.1 DNA-binding transcriptional MerR regulator [Metabacillus malikii]